MLYISHLPERPFNGSLIAVTRSFLPASSSSYRVQTPYQSLMAMRVPHPAERVHSERAVELLATEEGDHSRSSLNSTARSFRLSRFVVPGGKEASDSRETYGGGGPFLASC